MKISLSKGGYTLIDEKFSDLVVAHKWYKSAYGYAASGTYKHRKRGIVYLHRLILGAKPGQEVDHINGDRLDNRRANLRLVTKSQNQANRKKPSKANTSGHTGVYFSVASQKWVAQLKFNNKTYFLGSFLNKQDAVKARLQAEARFFGSFAPGMS